MEHTHTPPDGKRIRYPDMTSTASCGECTGLMPTPPEDEAEYEAYQELYGMEIPKDEERGERPRDPRRC